MTAPRCFGGNACSANRNSVSRADVPSSRDAISGGVEVGVGALDFARIWSSALRYAMVTSQPRTLLSGLRSGYARNADTNVSDHASSASDGLNMARQTRNTTGPCSATTSSNGRTIGSASTVTSGKRTSAARREVPRQPARAAFGAGKQARAAFGAGKQARAALGAGKQARAAFGAGIQTPLQP